MPGSPSLPCTPGIPKRPGSPFPPFITNKSMSGFGY